MIIFLNFIKRILSRSQLTANRTIICYHVAYGNIGTSLGKSQCHGPAQALPASGNQYTLSLMSQVRYRHSSLLLINVLIIRYRHVTDDRWAQHRARVASLPSSAPSQQIHRDLLVFPQSFLWSFPSLPLKYTCLPTDRVVQSSGLLPASCSMLDTAGHG